MREIYDHYLIDYRDGTRESIKDLNTFYNKYIEFKKDKKMGIVARWCGVDCRSSITSLSQYGLDNLFLWATEPETDGYVIFQKRDNTDYYKTNGGITSDLTRALILSKKQAEYQLRINKLYVGMKKCSVAQRNLGSLNNSL